jgi:hypothetical protein
MFVYHVMLFWNSERVVSHTLANCKSSRGLPGAELEGFGHLGKYQSWLFICRNLGGWYKINFTTENNSCTEALRSHHLQELYKIERANDNGDRRARTEVQHVPANEATRLSIFEIYDL